MEIRWTKTDRGFKHYAPIKHADGSETKIYESSAADAPHLWMDADGDCTHLTLDDAAKLCAVLDEDDPVRQTLTVAIERHYQLPQPDPVLWKAGDPCSQCGSTDTGIEGDLAFCRSCDARDEE